LPDQRALHPGNVVMPTTSPTVSLTTGVCERHQ
jgi:hypothetical protein